MHVGVHTQPTPHPHPPHQVPVDKACLDLTDFKVRTTGRSLQPPSLAPTADACRGGEEKGRNRASLSCCFLPAPCSVRICGAKGSVRVSSHWQGLEVKSLLFWGALEDTSAQLAVLPKRSLGTQSFHSLPFELSWCFVKSLTLPKAEWDDFIISAMCCGGRKASCSTAAHEQPLCRLRSPSSGRKGRRWKGLVYLLTPLSSPNGRGISKIYTRSYKTEVKR